MLKNTKIPKKYLLLVLLVILCVSAGFVYYANQKSNSKTANPSVPGYINLNPPTEEEKKSGDNKKPEIVDQEAKRNNQSQISNTGSVTPSITFAGQYGTQIEVGAYVSSILEDGGTCTLTLLQGEQSRTTSVQAIKNTNSVDCPAMIIPRDSMPPGTYQASVRYSSKTYEGTSEIRNIVLE